ncbi:MAG: hypothetical protein ACRCXC_10995 [Legionella sp.]
MEFISEIKAAIKSGIEGFKEYIEVQLQKDTNYLQHHFWIDEGIQITVLNYLIQQYSEKKQGKKST